MSSIVFLLGKFYPEFDANIICCNNIIKQLRIDGNKVIVIAGSTKENSHDCVNGLDVYRVKNTDSDKYCNYINGNVIKRTAYKFARMVRSLIRVNKFPDVESNFSKSLYQVLETVCEKQQVDCIIGAFRPYSTIKAMLLYKENHPEKKIKFIGYYLDVLRGAVKPFGAPKSLYDKLCISADFKTFNSLDCILMAENGKMYYNNPLFDKLRKKIHYINFPMLIIKPNIAISVCKKTFTYVGYLDREYRNPILVIKLFNQLKREGFDLELHLYGSSNMDDDIKSLVDCKTTFYHGRLNREDVEHVLLNSDVLVSFGNNIPGIVPSKIFELMGYKKPILHVVKDEYDCSINYMKEYPNVCVLYENSGFENLKKEVLSFLNQKSFFVTDEYLNNTFYRATPEASTKIIYDCIEK